MAQQRTRRRNDNLAPQRRSARRSERPARRASRHASPSNGRNAARRRRAEEPEIRQQPQRRANSQGGRHVEALDGCRAIAIISIVLYHLSVPWLPSGHMGVVLFLVLTGYLATASILKVLRRDGALSIPHLWLKRVVRIWPSMALMIVVTVAIILFRQPRRNIAAHTPLVPWCRPSVFCGMVPIAGNSVPRGQANTSRTACRLGPHLGFRRTHGRALRPKRRPHARLLRT